MPTVRYDMVDQFEMSPGSRSSFDVTNHTGDLYSYPGLFRPGTVTFTTRQPHSLGRCIDVELPGGYRSKGFCTRVEEAIGGLYKETIQLSGKPERAGFLASALQQSAKELARSIRNAAPFDTGALHDSINCRCIVGVDWASDAFKKERPVKIRNRFYLAAPHVTSASEQAQDNTPDKVALSTPIVRSSGESFGGRQTGRHNPGKWTRKDLKAAIAHAEEVLAAQPERDHVAVVRIVKIVRRPKPKFVVEDVK